MHSNFDTFQKFYIHEIYHMLPCNTHAHGGISTQVARMQAVECSWLQCKSSLCPEINLHPVFHRMPVNANQNSMPHKPFSFRAVVNVKETGRFTFPTQYKGYARGSNSATKTFWRVLIILHPLYNVVIS